MPDGTQVFCWRMENAHGLYAELLDYGAALRALFVPDRDGVLRDVAQGYDTLDEYRSNGGSFGATIGRVANRIGGASFELNGINYPLAQNCGPHHIHGGTVGFPNRNRKLFPDVSNAFLSFPLVFRYSRTPF